MRNAPIRVTAGGLPFDMVADWQPDRSTDLLSIGRDIVSLAAIMAFFCVLAGAAALIVY